MAASCDNKSHFHKTVHLHEWWLIWGENENHEKRLAIAGYTSLGQRALRVFSSSPILRRLDVFTLETTDGTHVRINGLLNKTRTAENGFPSEVYKCFFIGFPPHWEACAEQYLAQGFASNDLLREDASLKGSSQTIEEYNTTNVAENVSPVSADPKQDKDCAVRLTREGSQNYDKTVVYINEAGGAKDLAQKQTAEYEMDSNLKENEGIKEASKAEKKTYNNASTEDASFKGCSNANAHINELNAARENINLANTDPELEQDHTACMTTEGSKNSNEAVKYITRSHGAKDTDQKKTADVKKASTSTEKAALKETSAPEKKTKRKLTYGSPVTPKADVITSVISPGLSSVKRSRSGRLLLPTLEYWRNQTAVYDTDHQLVGIKDEISMPSRAESTHESKRSAGRSRSKKNTNAAMDKSTHKPKRAVGKPRNKKDPDAKEVIKSTRKR